MRGERIRHDALVFESHAEGFTEGVERGEVRGCAGGRVVEDGGGVPLGFVLRGGGRVGVELEGSEGEGEVCGGGGGVGAVRG